MKAGWVWRVERWAAVCAVVGLVGLSGCERGSKSTGGAERATLEKHAHAREVMGTFAEVQAHAVDEATARRGVEAAYAALDRVNALMSDYRDDSEISALKRAEPGARVAVSFDTWACLGLARAAGAISGGAFDATVRPLIGVWRAAAQAGELPTNDALAAARARVGWEKVVLQPEFAGDQRLAELRRNAWRARELPREYFAARVAEGVEVDLGGIAKGYALDLAAEALREAGAAAGIVNVGGDIVFVGERPDGDGWRVGVRHPFADGLFGTLVLRKVGASRAVATSGLQQRFFEIDGQRYSHIIDPRSGRPAEEAPSVTVIAEDGTTADAFATILSVLSVAEGRALLANEPRAGGVEALWIAGPAEQPRLEMTGGFEAFLVRE